jgi:hypothetical protein
MNFSFKDIKEKLLNRLSDKYSTEHISKGFDTVQEKLLKELKEIADKEQETLKEFTKTEEYAKMKKLSYWIFNNYGIPIDDKNPFSMHLGRGFVLSDKIKNRDIIYYKVKNGTLNRVFDLIKSEYLGEYTDGYISYNENTFSPEILSTPESIFELVEKELYSGYKYTSDFLDSDTNRTFHKFIRFKTKVDSLLNHEATVTVEKAEIKKEYYLNNQGDRDQAKIIIPLSGLAYDSLKDDAITSEAKRLGISKKELLNMVKENIKILSSNGFITLGSVYCTDLMDLALFRRVWYFLSWDNEPLIVEMGDADDQNYYNQ